MTEPGKNQSADNAAAASTPVKWAALGLVMLVCLALLAALAEGAVRLRQSLRTGSAVSQTAMYTEDERWQLRVLKPNFRTSRISINSSGFRGPEIDTPKPPGRVRIAFLGASTTFCAEVSGDTLVWPHLVVEQLRAAYPGTAFDYVNGGVPGYFASSSLLNLKHRVAAHQPDIVVIYHATNNLSRETRDMAIAQGLDDAVESGQLSWLERHSLLWELVVKNLRVRRAQQTANHPGGQKLTIDPARIGAKFETDMSALVRESSKVASRVAVATFSTRLRTGQTPEQQGQAAVSALVYSPFMSVEGLLRGFSRYNTLIRQVAAKQDALLIDSEDSIPGDAAHFVDTVHFTDAGSRKMAERVFLSLRSDARIAALAAAQRQR